MSVQMPMCERMVHISGGMLVVSEIGTTTARFWPRTVHGKEMEINFLEYQNLYSAIESLGFRIIGIDFIKHEIEATGGAPPEWRSYTPVAGNRSVNASSRQLWSQLATASFLAKSGLSYDLCLRIKYQLDSLAQRLKDLSVAYQQQLYAHCLKGKHTSGRRFQDGFTDITYQKFHSFLFDACILRDYLCEYVYLYSDNGKLIEVGAAVTTASKLLKILRHRKDLSELEVNLVTQMEDGGWIKELGAYRDLVMHSAPINIANQNSWCIAEDKEANHGEIFPSIKVPIPSDPARLKSKRSMRDNFDQYLAEMAMIERASFEDEGAHDCLDYAALTTTNLSSISFEIAKLSPYNPMMTKYTQNSGEEVAKVDYIEMNFPA